jgi:hypothetical protein
MRQKHHLRKIRAVFVTDVTVHTALVGVHTALANIHVALVGFYIVLAIACVVLVIAVADRKLARVAYVNQLVFFL